MPITTVTSITRRRSRSIDCTVVTVDGLTLQIRGIVAATEPKTIQKAVQISGALTDEVVRNRSIKKVEKRGNVGGGGMGKGGKGGEGGKGKGGEEGGGREMEGGGGWGRREGRVGWGGRKGDGGGNGKGTGGWGRDGG
ncbi:hypothetical protein Tco_0554483 [Tanacetum coccineum]